MFFPKSNCTMFIDRRVFVVAALAIAAPSAVLHTQAAPPQQPRPNTSATGFDTTGVGDTSLFAPLNLPPGNMFRSASGIPGPKYWQQHADYDLHGTLDTAAKSLQGEMTLRYTNNSPDTLRFVWFQVEQNAFKNGSLNSLVFPADSRFGARNFEGGDMIDHFDEVTAGKKTALKMRVEGTVMKVDLATPLPPGQSTTFDAAWHFNIPEHGADRMGRDGSLFELAQWYPRLCVYDDLRGLNTEPYLGQGEFYLEYGDINLSVTVPAGFIVAATGALQNAAEVLTTTQISRLAQAAKSDTPIHIITQAELENGSARPKKTGMVTWRFKAHDVRDAVWATAPNYHVGRVELAGSHGVRVLPSERYRYVEGRGGHVAHVDHGILGALVPISVPADQRRRGADQRHGIPHARHGRPEPRQIRALQRGHARDRTHVVSDDRRVE